MNITIAAIADYYLTHRVTGSYFFQRDIMDEQVLNERLDFNDESIIRIVRKG